MSAPAKGILGQLFGRAKAGLFEAPAWPNHSIVHHGPMSRLPEIFRTGDVSSVERLAAAIEAPEARGLDNPATGYRGDAVFMGKRRSQRPFSVRSASASRLYRAGLNIMFHEFRLPSVESWLEELAAEIGIANHLIRLYGFAAPPGEDNGTDAHWDPNEVIHIQLRGRKRFRLAPNKHVVQPSIGGIARDSFSEDSVAEMRGHVPLEAPRRWHLVELRPGSVLYFPRGYWHETSTIDESFAIGLGLYWPTPLDVVLPYLKTLLRRDLAWRRPLFGMLKNGDARARHEAALASRFRDVGVDEAMAPVAALAMTGGPTHRLATDAERLHFVRMPMSLSAKRAEAGWLTTIRTLKGQDILELEVGARLLRVLKWIDSRRGSFTIADLRSRFPDVDGDEHREILRVLISVAAVQIDARPASPPSRRLKPSSRLQSGERPELESQDSPPK
jgi:hypothetical protein